MDGVRETICECKDEHSGLHIVEGHQPLITVHINSNPWGSEVDRQAGCRFCSEGVICPIPQAEEPITMGRAYCNFALPIYRVACHSQVPVCLSSHLHLKEGKVLQFIAMNADFPLKSFWYAPWMEFPPSDRSYNNKSFQSLRKFKSVPLIVQYFRHKINTLTT